MNAIETEQIFTEPLYRIRNRVIVLIPSPWNTLSDSDRILLSKILGSVKLSLDGVQIITTNEASIEDLKIFNPTIIISFGTAFKQSIEPYTIEIVDTIKIIHSDALNTLDDSQKKSLWNALKQAFQA